MDSGQTEIRLPRRYTNLSPNRLASSTRLTAIEEACDSDVSLTSRICEKRGNCRSLQKGGPRREKSSRDKTLKIICDFESCDTNVETSHEEKKTNIHLPDLLHFERTVCCSLATVGGKRSSCCPTLIVKHTVRPLLKLKCTPLLILRLLKCIYTNSWCITVNCIETFPSSHVSQVHMLPCGYISDSQVKLDIPTLDRREQSDDGK